MNRKKRPFQLNLPRFTELLKRMNDNLLENLSKETLRLISLQSNTFKEVLDIDNFLNANADTKQKTIGVQEIKEWTGHLENERQKLEKMEMVLAVSGTMKAGKSTTINAIVGMEILPNRETAMTTLPTLIRNKHGQQQPILKISKIAPLLELSKAVAKKLKTLSESEISQIDLQGIEDGKSLIAGLRQNGGYHFTTEYEGQNGIFEFLKHLNDIMRLAKDKTIAIEPPYHEYENLDNLPVIEVEFCHLKGMQNNAHGSLAILDTPGPDEFGQSTELRRVFTTQLKQASAILLVVDFTKMNNESDAAVRKQLDEIKDQLSKDRLSVIVNKFDNAQTMTVQQTKEYVAGKLMAGEVEISNIFPVSSRHAYLANRARSHLERHETLPNYEQEPWVADFANQALGTLWKKYINNYGKEDFQEYIDSLWEGSLFKEPLEKVIEEAHTTAANKCLASAIEKLADCNSEFLNMLNIHSRTMSKSIEDIQNMMDALQADVKHCENVGKEIDDKVKFAVSDLSQAMKKVMEAQWGHVNNTLNKFFEEGKAIEDNIKNEMLDAEIKEQLEAVNVRNIARKFFESLNPENFKEGYCLREYYKEEIEKRFDTNSTKITCSNAAEAELLVVEISKQIANIFKNADEELNLTANYLVKQTAEDITQKVNDSVVNTLEKAKNKLDDKGVEINFKLLAIDLAISDIDTTKIFKSSYQQGLEPKDLWRRKKGVWGSVCDIFCTWEWGWETYVGDVTVYKVDLEKIKNQVTQQLEQQTRHLSNQTEVYLGKKFQPQIENHLKELVKYLKHYRGVLADGMKSSELDQAAKLELKKELEKRLKSQAIIKQDISVVKNAI